MIPKIKEEVLSELQKRAAAARAADPDIAKWLQTMPQHAILIHTPLDIPFRENRLKIALEGGRL